MTCREEQRLIVPFIQEQLDEIKIEDFLDHLYNCPKCKDEYEVYFSLLIGMKILENDRSSEEGMIVDAGLYLKREEEKLLEIKMRKVHIRLTLIGILMIVMILIK